MSQEIRGFSFKQADELANKLGIPKGSVIRIVAGLRHCLLIAAIRFGHCIVPLPNLLLECSTLLDLPPFTIYENLLLELKNKEPKVRRIFPESIKIPEFNSFENELSFFFLSSKEKKSFISRFEMYDKERGVAAHLHRLLAHQNHPFSTLLPTSSIQEITERFTQGLLFFHLYLNYFLPTPIHYTPFFD